MSQHHIEERLRQLAGGRDDLVKAVIGTKPLNRSTLPSIIREILTRKYTPEPPTSLARDLQYKGVGQDNQPQEARSEAHEPSA